jgi:hypothetical protein
LVEENKGANKQDGYQYKGGDFYELFHE